MKYDAVTIEFREKPIFRIFSEEREKKGGSDQRMTILLHLEIEFKATIFFFIELFFH